MLREGLQAVFAVDDCMIFDGFLSALMPCRSRGRSWEGLWDQGFSQAGRLKKASRVRLK